MTWESWATLGTTTSIGTYIIDKSSINESLNEKKDRIKRAGEVLRGKDVTPTVEEQPEVEGENITETTTSGITISKTRVKNTLTTTMTTVSTCALSKCLNKHYLDQIYDRSLTTYVGAMSDEELTEALEKFNLLDSTEEDAKTNIK